MNLTEVRRMAERGFGDKGEQVRGRGVGQEM